MTVSATDSTAVFDGNGVATNFPFNFTFDNDSEIKVYSKEVATGIVTELTSGFTVNGAGDDDGGSVDMDVAPATGFKLVVSRELVLEQQTDLRNRGNFFPEVHEKVFDRLTKMIQQLSDQVSRAVKTDISGDQTADELMADLNAAAASAQASADAAAASVALLADTGDLFPTLLNSFTNWSTAVRYRKIGKQVFVSGQVSRATTGIGVNIFVLPVGFRPSATNIFVVECFGSGNNSRQPFSISVNSSGEVAMLWSTGGAENAVLPTTPFSFGLAFSFLVA